MELGPRMSKLGEGQCLCRDPNGVKLEVGREAAAQILRETRDWGRDCGVGCTQGFAFRQRDKPFPRKAVRSWKVAQKGVPILGDSARGGTGHGAAVGGMCTHSTLHPLVLGGTPEDGLEGKLVGLGTWMAPDVPIRCGRDTWSKGEEAARENRILWGHI